MANPIDSAGIFSVLTSHAQSLGVFRAINGHEPKSAPPQGAAVSFWLDRWTPVREQSGLSTVSVLLVVTARITNPFLREPQDSIDPALVNASDALLSSLVGDFDCGGLASHIDVFGQFGIPLEGRGGYLNEAGVIFRIVAVTIPIVINDVWDEVA